MQRKPDIPETVAIFFNGALIVLGVAAFFT
jgi:hypothetical protein